MRKAKAHLEINLTKEVKDNKKGFFKYVKSKRKTTENVSLLLNEMGVLVTEDTENAELLNTFFASALDVRTALEESQTLELSLKKERLPLGLGGSGQRSSRQTQDTQIHGS